MQNVIGDGRRRWKSRLACIAGLAAGLSACGESARVSETPVTPTRAHSAMTTSATAGADATASNTRYSVINLFSGFDSYMPDINASGQVAFSAFHNGAMRGGFFSGAKVIDIGHLGAGETYATALNDSGQVTGSSNRSGNRRTAFIWTESSGMFGVGGFGPDGGGAAADINVHGQIAGYSNYAGGMFDRHHAFVWSDAGGLRDLGTLGQRGSAGAAINDSGMVIGYSRMPDNHDHGFAWTSSGGMRDIGTLGGIASYATLVNNAGLVAGHSLVVEEPFYYRGFVWTADSGIADIGTLGGLASAPRAMNEAGQVVGHADSACGYQNAFSWTAQAGMVGLGAACGAQSSALGVNRHGHIVGLANALGGAPATRAFLWTPAKGLVDLNDRLFRPLPGLELHAALAISDNGSIVVMSNAGLLLLRPGPHATNAPVVGPISPGDPVPVGTPLTFSAPFHDQDHADTHTAIWNWTDASWDDPGTFSSTGGVNYVSGSHTYTWPNVHLVIVTVTDSSGHSTVMERTQVVYDPAPGNVAGSGWFSSPQGAIKSDRMHIGKASFAFASSGRMAAPRPKGVKLQFNAGALHFESDDLEPARIAGSGFEARGGGALNGAPGYSFMLEAIEGGASGQSGQGSFRIRIWHRDAQAGTDVVDYDNQPAPGPTVAVAKMRMPGSAIEGGSIRISR